MQERCLSVVVPVYNEEDTLATIVDKLLTLPQLLEIVIVDDCSTDKTSEILLRLCEKHKEIRAVRPGPPHCHRQRDQAAAVHAAQHIAAVIEQAGDAGVPGALQIILDRRPAFALRKATLLSFRMPISNTPRKKSPA